MRHAYTCSSSRYDEIKTRFSNNHQKGAAELRVCHPTAKDDLGSTLVPITCEGREVRMRPDALAACPQADRSDESFYEVVLIHDFRLLVKEWNERVGLEAASGLLDIKA